MIGVDTNVLVRYLTQDDTRQARAMDALIAGTLEGPEHLFIDDVVLCELVWVLRAAYRFDEETIGSAIDRILDTALFASKIAIFCAAR
jgi:predicted nucleic-acid-binding protein